MNVNVEQIEVVIPYDETNCALAEVMRIGPTTARIPDMSFAGDHRGDIVELIPPAENGQVSQIGRVLYREYEAQIRVWYEHEWQYWELKAIMEPLGGAVETVGSPSSAGI
jgi:hypothetical protein